MKQDFSANPLVVGQTLLVSFFVFFFLLTLHYLNGISRLPLASMFPIKYTNSLGKNGIQEPTWQTRPARMKKRRVCQIQELRGGIKAKSSDSHLDHSLPPYVGYMHQRCHENLLPVSFHKGALKGPTAVCQKKTD